MKQLDEIQQRFENLESRDRKLVILMTVIVIITLFYTLLWEPVHKKLESNKTDHAAQTGIYQWMLNAEAEVAALKSSGNRGTVQRKNSPVSIVAEQSAKTSGIKNQVGKIESSGKNSAQIQIDNASFDQMLLWINALKIRYGITIASAKIERTDKSGIINARLTLQRI